MRETALVKAVKAGDLERCRALIRKRVNVDAGDAGWRPIHYACQSGNLPIASLLIDAGARLTGGISEPFYFASSSRNFEICRLLVDAGVNPHEPNVAGYNQLLQSCMSGDAVAVQFLISAGADVEFIGREGRTPLALAAEADHVDVVKLLIAAGADPALPRVKCGNPARTAFQTAVQSDSTRVMEYFVTELAEDLAQRTVDGKTLSQIARAGGAAHQMLVSVRAAQLISDSVEAGGSTAARLATRGMAPTPLGLL